MSNIITKAQALEFLDDADFGLGGKLIELPITYSIVEAVEPIAYSRKIMAKLANNGGDYAKAIEQIKRNPGEMNRERRGVLAELAIHEILKASGVEFDMQPLVDFLPRPGADIQFYGKSYDIKAVSEYAPKWSCHGSKRGDGFVPIGEAQHEQFLAKKGFAGYFCVYFKMKDEQPATAVIYLLPAEVVSSFEISPGRVNGIVRGEVQKMDYHRCPINRL